jgi:hypothetical protein
MQNGIHLVIPGHSLISNSLELFTQVLADSGRAPLLRLREKSSGIEVKSRYGRGKSTHHKTERHVLFKYFFPSWQLFCGVGLLNIRCTVH